jgi:hypothetical protein
MKCRVVPGSAWLIAITAVVTALTTGIASATPLFSASAGLNTSSTIGNCNPIGGSGSSSGPLSFHIVCGDGGGNGSATGTASSGHLGAESSAVSSAFSIAGFNAGAEHFDSVVFTAADPSAFPGGIPVSFNLSFAGTLNAAYPALAEVRVLVQINGNEVARYDHLTNGGSDDFCNSSFVGGKGCGAVVLDGSVTTGSVTVPLDVPIGFLLSLQVQSGAFGGSARAEFGNSLDLPTGIDVFNLPVGVTANAPDSNIINNRFVSGAAQVPEPSTLALLGSGILVLGWVRRRRP